MGTRPTFDDPEVPKLAVVGSATESDRAHVGVTASRQFWPGSPALCATFSALEDTDLSAAESHSN